MEKEKVLATLEEIRAYSDPYRIEILFAFEKFSRPATCKEIADSMGEVPAKVHYHIKKMEKVNILKLVYTKNINGIIAKYYEPTAEKFLIVRKSQENKVTADQYLNIITDVFDKAQKDFLNIAQNNKKNNRKNKGVLQYSEVYLTDEEAEKIHKYIDNIIEGREYNKNKNYRLLFSIIKNNDI